MSEIRGTLLYEAATNALASDASNENTWTKMVTASFAHSGDRVAFYKELKTVEKQIKKEYGLKAMPGAWRGAKSIVLAAMLQGIVMADENGKIKGKTAIQELIKALIPEKVIDPYMESVKKIDWVQTMVSMLDSDQQRVLRDQVKNLFESLGG